MMRLIQTGFYEEEELLGEWRRRGNQGLFLPPGALLDSLKDDENLIADCIVCTADEELRLGDDLQVLPLPTALQIADEIARLDDRLTMPDGRKWKSLPVVILVRGAMQGDFGPLNGGDGVSVAPYLGPEHTLSLLKMVVTDYRQQLMNEMDNLGLLVTYEQGRYRVGHVLGGTAATEGVYYAPHADRRLRFPGHLFTVDRDYLGVQREVEGFESLINDPEVTEPELQDFFERHPHFLPMQTLSQAIPQVRLEGVDGDAQIPDFVLRPIVARQRLRDRNWEVLDLKRPQVRLLVGPSNHVRFSHDVQMALTQLRDYGDYFADPRHASTIDDLLGYRLRYPRLAVLIGRLPSGEELAELNQQQERDQDVRIVTYDELLDRQKQGLDD